jgi:hypothetical protein
MQFGGVIIATLSLSFPYAMIWTVRGRSFLLSLLHSLLSYSYSRTFYRDMTGVGTRVQKSTLFDSAQNRWTANLLDHPAPVADSALKVPMFLAEILAPRLHTTSQFSSGG